MKILRIWQMVGDEYKNTYCSRADYIYPEPSGTTIMLYDEGLHERKTDARTIVLLSPGQIAEIGEVLDDNP